MHIDRYKEFKKNLKPGAIVCAEVDGNWFLVMKFQEKNLVLNNGSKIFATTVNQFHVCNDIREAQQKQDVVSV